MGRAGLALVAAALVALAVAALVFGLLRRSPSGAVSAAPSVAAPPPVAGYRLDRPAGSVALPLELMEVSGLAADAAGRVFAHSDEHAVIYQVDYRRGRIVKRFGLGRPVVRRDFEGLAIADGRFFLVVSDGTIYESGEGADGENVAFIKHATGAGNQCEIEGAAYEPADRSLLLVCKESRTGQLRASLAVFRWSIERRLLEASPRPLIPLSAVSRAGGPDAFRASGIERNPATGNYVIIAARNRGVVEVTPSGEVVSAGRLPARHAQAEGITFAGDGMMIVSDEGVKGAGTLTLYSAR